MLFLCLLFFKGRLLKQQREEDNVRQRRKEEKKRRHEEKKLNNEMKNSQTNNTEGIKQSFHVLYSSFLKVVLYITQKTFLFLEMTNNEKMSQSVSQGLFV